jgi:5-methylcytosine-specific restriction endonuclease McrA
VKKICKRCGVEKEITEFYKNSRYKDGHLTWCKDCMHEYIKEWDSKNPERHIARSKKYKENNRSKINEKRNRRRAENPEKTKAEYRKYELGRKGKRIAQKADWYFRNAEKIKDGKRKEYAENREVESKRKSKYAREHPEIGRLRNNKRRAKLLNAPGIGITYKEWSLIVTRYGNKCLACGATEKIEMDHIVPLSKGGAHDPSNVQPLCKSCNCKKHDKIMDYRRALEDAREVIDDAALIDDDGTSLQNSLIRQEAAYWLKEYPKSSI